MATSRRAFLERAALGGLAIGGLGLLDRLRPVSAAEAKIDPALVRLGDDIEPTVRLLEQTPRDKLLEEVAHRINQGLSYGQLLTALLLAGVRNVQPRPAVGFKFHAVLVINSAHLASLASPDHDRWLPIFWALDRFKASQAETQSTTGWHMAPVDESKVPAPDKAQKAFAAAMDAWDEQAANAAASALARSCTRDQCFELFARYGSRDFRDIGHKAIFVSNSFRLLDCIGWRHVEPVLRSLAYALMKYDGQNPAKSDQPADRPGRQNAELARKIRADWLDGKPDRAASASLLKVFRQNSPEDACSAVADALNRGIAPSSISDALLCASGELLMRQPGIATLHSVTSSNALHFAYQSAMEPGNRLMMLLQNTAFVCLFRQMLNRNAREVIVDEFEATPTSASGADAVGEILAQISQDRMAASRKTLAYLDAGGNPHDLMHAARRLVFMKGNDAHDYKFSSAVMEDFYTISPALRNRYLAASCFYLPGSGANDNPLVQRIRAAFAN